MKEAAGEYAMSPQAVASAIAYAIEQPGAINIGEVVKFSSGRADFAAVSTGRDVIAR